MIRPCSPIRPIHPTHHRELQAKLYGMIDDEIAIVEGRSETNQEPQGETAGRPSASSRKRKQVPPPARTSQ